MSRRSMFVVVVLASAACDGEPTSPRGARVLAAGYDAWSLAVDTSGVYFTSREDFFDDNDLLLRIDAAGIVHPYPAEIPAVGYNAHHLTLTQRAVVVGGRWRYRKDATALLEVGWEAETDWRVDVRPPLVRIGTSFVFVGSYDDPTDDGWGCNDVVIAPAAGGLVRSLYHATPVDADGCGLLTMAVVGDTIYAFDSGRLVRIDIATGQVEADDRVADAGWNVIAMTAAGGALWWVAHPERAGLRAQLHRMELAGGPDRILAEYDANGGSIPTTLVASPGWAFVIGDRETLRAHPADGGPAVDVDIGGMGHVDKYPAIAVDTDAVYWIADARDEIMRLPLALLDAAR